jgi:hypothetical protein
MPNISNVELVIGIVLVLLGISFAYKTYLASVLGKCYYWTGFLPLTVISPWVCHLPPASKRSLTKTAHGLWVHFFMGPIYLVCTVLCFVAGAEFLGLPGVSSLNYVLVGGNLGKAACVAFNKHTGFRFPFLERSRDTMAKRIEKVQLMTSQDRQLLPDTPPKSIRAQMDEAHNNPNGNY